MDNDRQPDRKVPIADHELLRIIGRGSYGAVWLARNTMGNFRAVKIVFRDTFRDRRPFDREWSGIRKFEPISRSHEGFMDVLQVGMNEPEGYFYYVMELGDDKETGQNIDPERYTPKTLGRELELSHRFTFEECLQLGLALSLALGELHKHGLVHRDIKPSNIIFVNGVPKLADIGLVAEASHDVSLVGTEGFIPPEGPGKPPADVYSLGKVLYEISTGKDRNEFPELPTRLDEFAEPEKFLELNEIILRACQNDAKERYQTAWDMHAQLLVIANGQSVRRLRVLEKRLSTLKRVSGIAVIVLVFLTVMGWQGYREWKLSLESHQRKVGGYIADGTQAMDSGDLQGAMVYFENALRLENKAGNRERELRLRFGSAMAQSPRLARFWEGGTNLKDVAWSPDGDSILVADIADQSKVYELKNTRSTPAGLGTGKSEWAVSYGNDSRFIVTGSLTGKARVRDSKTLEMLFELQHGESVFSARISPDGKWILTAGGSNCAKLWNFESHKEVRILQHEKPVRFATFSHDGNLIVTTSEDCSAKLWDLSGRLIKEFSGHQSWVVHAAFSPDDRRVITASLDKTASAWSVDPLNTSRQQIVLTDGINGVDYSPDGRTIVTACWDGNVYLWDSETLLPQMPVHVLRTDGHPMRAPFSPDGRFVAVACEEGCIWIWDLAKVESPLSMGNGRASQDGRLMVRSIETKLLVQKTDSTDSNVFIILDKPGIETATLTANGQFLLLTLKHNPPTGSANQSLEVWDLKRRSQIGQTIRPDALITGAVMSDDASRVVTYTDTKVQFWRVDNGLPYGESKLVRDRIKLVLLDREGKRAIIKGERSVSVLDVQTCRELFPALIHGGDKVCVAPGHKGNLLATGWNNDQVSPCFAQIWDTETGKPIGGRFGHRDGILCVAFSPDDKRLVTSSEDNTAVVWDIATSKQLTPPMRLGDDAVIAAFSPDGRWIVTVCKDGSCRVWDSQTGLPLTLPFQFTTKFVDAKFLAESDQVLCVDSNKNTWIWKLPIEESTDSKLKSFSSLISAGTVIITDDIQSSRPVPLLSSWEQLHRDFSPAFTTPPEEVANWYEFMAAKSEKEKQWPAAVYNLERLVSLRPTDSATAERLERAKRELRALH